MGLYTDTFLDHCVFAVVLIEYIIIFMLPLQLGWPCGELGHSDSWEDRDSQKKPIFKFILGKETNTWAKIRISSRQVVYCQSVSGEERQEVVLLAVSQLIRCYNLASDD